MIINTIIFAVLNILILLWWRYACEWTNSKQKFPARGHIVLFGLVGCVPIVNIVMLAVLCGVYGGMKATGDLKLKKNKFNKYWFDVE